MIANHLWQSTVFALGVWLITLVLRRNCAAVRHWLWLIASSKFLVPLAAVSLFTSLIPPLTVVSHTVPAAVIRFSEPFPATELPAIIASAATVAETSRRSPLLVAIAVVWAAGVATGLFFWIQRWLQLRRSARAGVPLNLEFPVPVLLCAERMEPGVFGILRPVLLLPYGLTELLSPPQLKTVLAHERTHIRRQDNLTAAIHMVVETIFWFHPVVWWIKRRLLEEQERACDEAVLQTDGDSQAYAEAIIRICEFYLKAPFCVAGITGADLKKRIVEIMSNRERLRLSWPKIALLSSAAVAAVAVPIVMGAVRASPAPRTFGVWHFQSTTQPRETFEVASVKPSDPAAPPVPGTRGGGGGPCTGDVTQIGPSQITISDATLFSLIELAYGQGSCMRWSKYGVISGGPNWIRTQKYTIQAKLPEGFPHYTMKQVREGEAQRLQAILRALLEERFKLVMHLVRKEVPVYELTPAKDGVKLDWNGDRTKEGAQRTREGDCDNIDPTGIRNGVVLTKPFCGSRVLTFAGEPPRSWLLRMTGATVQHLASMLELSVDRPIVDRSNIDGLINLQMTFAFDGHTPLPPGTVAITPVDPDPGVPSLFTALQEKIGLKLQPARGAIDTWVVDHAERPVQ